MKLYEIVLILICLGCVSPSLDASVPEAKMLSDGSAVSCSGTVTAVFPDYFYIELPERASGLRVRKTGFTATVGSTATVSGTMGTISATGERYINAATVQQSAGTAIRPLGMTIKNLGGGDWNYMSDGPVTLSGQKGIVGRGGLNNIGLFVKLAGRVSNSDSAQGVFYIDDGSGTPLRVACPAGTAPVNGAFVTVTGISSCGDIGQGILPSILAPTAQDIFNTQTVADFRVGVYLNADTHSSNLQISRMMADFAAHGVTKVVMLSKLYVQYAPQGINSLAKMWGIDLYVSNIWDAAQSTSLSAQQANMQMMINLANSYPDSDAVVGWYAGDEMEYGFNPTTDPTVETRLRDFVTMLKALDPTRKVLVNHDTRTANWGRFLQFGEDESWCSAFWANHYATNRLNNAMSQYRTAYGQGATPLSFAYGAASTNTFTTQQNITDAGLEGVNLAQLQAIPTRTDIADYINTAYQLGASGASFYRYDGYYEDTYYSLVSARGASASLKMEGILDAVKAIRTSQGYPSLSLSVQINTKSLTVTVSNTAGSRPVTSTYVYISYDGGYSWQPISGFNASGGVVTYNIPNYPVRRPYWSMVRARCYDGQKFSGWSVWNVYP